ncbi:MAG: hypothetical protein M3Z92_14915 [Bacteroidota bacterium]|nr:hypothetical protein [Bacteroidota bacterium]
METEIVETVLTEILGELKRSNELNKENSNAILKNDNLLIAIEKQLGNKDVAKPEINNRSIEQIISTGINNITAMIKQHPPTVKREFRVLLFPEQNTKEYYQIVFSRIIFWLVVLVIAKYIYLMGSEWIIKHYENQKYKKAWENLYKHQEKANQKMMQRIIDLE